VASGTYSFAAGDSADATGAAAVAFGSSTLASGVTSVAMGIRTTVSEQGGLICGVYGTAPNDALFTVANGTSTADDEAFIVYNTGNVWVENNLSAQSITDRTPYPDSLQTAIDAVNSMQRLPEGEYEHDNKEKQLDHSVLHNYLKAGEVSRDMSATISCHNEAIKFLLKKIEELESKI